MIAKRTAGRIKTAAAARSAISRRIAYNPANPVSIDAMVAPDPLRPGHRFPMISKRKIGGLI